MKQSEIVNLSVAELQDQLTELVSAYNNLKSAHAISPIENPLQIKSVRRSIARVKTELSKRELQ
ncbi:50S ribosomal protein L29 [Myroides pelagicus]|uniref:Large ribosomal subunit protein uL29 n=1 Tax=Myroides pelagicus TaxID=270914 RepID=A0A7K1GKI3_9FLAO|nr:50S ribosomal protein L29 [Myroides pelagicus]MEC4114443.1 50S ribosomal protein L29 [Myroides pelagicus]MTH28724.1 50S ribosomal protein L29 [Myroides pelagicus]